MSTPGLRPSHRFGSAYAVALPGFYGPLELLLQLIEQEKLDISAISLVAVTDQYLQTIEQLEEREPGALADFLVVASKLLYLKSRNLLPKPQPAVEGEAEDPSDGLIKQLLEYRHFKAVAATLHEREMLGLRTYPRPPGPPVEKQLDLSNLDVTKLHAMLQRVLQRMPGEPVLPRVKAYSITVAEQIEVVRTRLRQGLAGGGAGLLTFGWLLQQSATRLEVIVTFLAVLELIKQQEVVVTQTELFGEIVLQPVMALPPAED
jgi:segregation and condensation protein A